MTPEGVVKYKGRAICKSLGIYQFPVQQGGTGRGGIPDDCLCCAGCFVFIEYKAKMLWHNRTKSAIATLPTLRQVTEMSNARKCGGFTFVVDANGLPYLENTLQVIIDAKKKLKGRAVLELVQLQPIWWGWKLQDYIDYTKGVGALQFACEGAVPKFIRH